ncbi:Aste57867_992 [Aphanomyces stellatus]|uniref:Carbonic anhydrase n=1 Tax=Aphanomyces stellatus TaxID=120398 RepID=A0A485K951_9STRA|nr:hypothetical protein As57867_000991 [Aphanomyces stellatus]VFT78214.1 Aste57867_992 [Aphanomyces stellatus]
MHVLTFFVAVAAVAAASTDPTPMVSLTSQSPIDLPRYLPHVHNQATWSLVVHADKGIVVHDTHTVKVLWAAGGPTTNASLTLNNHTYHSVHFHYHRPSEHTIAGKRYPLEVHFVHADKDNNLAVVGVLFDLDPQNKPNKFLCQWTKCRLAKVLHKPGDNYTVSKIDPSSFLNADRGSVYRYSGSLTTPPYAEGVEWSVLSTVQTLSKKQLAAFVKVIEEPNSRATQPLNGRRVKAIRRKCD